MSKKLELFPAVDVSGGKAVRLTQAIADSEQTYGSPLEVAQTWIASGAKWIHLVDLDAAFGRGDNRPVIQEVVAACNGVKTQISGGIVDASSFEAALSSGADRVNIATPALENLQWVASMISEFGEQIAVGLDVHGTALIGRGSTKEVGDLYKVLEVLEHAGCRRYVVTDVNRDGMMQGPNLELLRAVMDRTGKPIVSSGGISSLKDIEALRALGLEGAILGKALYANRFTLEQALELASK